MMLKKIILSLGIIVFLSSTTVAKQDIQLASDIVNGHLVPVIKINNKKVMTIQDKGSDRQFISTFDRAEYIYSMLVDLDSKGVDLSKIRVKRSKSDYYGEVKKHRIFKVSKGDRLSHDLTSYQVAKKWVEAVQDAIFLSDKNQGQVSVAQEVLIDTESVVAASSGFRLFQHRRKLVLWLQIMFIGIFQVVTVLAVLYVLDKRRGDKFQRIYDRMETTQRSVSDLKTSVQDIRTKLNKDIQVAQKGTGVKAFPKSGT